MRAPFPTLFRINTAALAVGLLIGIANSSMAGTSVGVSFIGRGSDQRLTRADLAGVVQQGFWNNVHDDGTTFKGTTPGLLDSAGNFTDVKVIYDCSDSWNSDGGTTTPDEKLMKGIIKANPAPDVGGPFNGSDRMAFAITNVPAGTYNVLIYMEENNVDVGTPPGPAEADVKLGNTTYYVEQQGAFTGSYFAASSTTPGSYVQGNYVEFDNVSPTVGAITFTATKHIVDPQVNDGIGVAAIQLIQVSGPAYPVNTSACTLTNPPSPLTNLVVAGSPAIFSITDSGNCKIQWQKNGVPIPGATDEVLNFAPAASDNNAQITAVVYNNVNTNTSVAATLFVDPNNPPVLTQGFSTVDRWENMNTTGGQQGVIDFITAIQAGPPTTSFYIAGVDLPQTNPDLNYFGARLTGWFKPDVSGDYTFFIRSDDSSMLFLNEVAAASGPNAIPDPSQTSPIAQENTCCNPFQEPGAAITTATANPYTLQAGKYYGFTILLKELTGGDYVQVAWRRAGDTTAAANLLPIPMANVYTMASAAGHRTAISSNPSNVVVLEDRPASFTVGVDTLPAGGAYGIQWLTNGVVVPGQTASRYTIPVTVLAQNNMQVKARIITLAGPLDSTVAVLTVNPDTFPPIVTGTGTIKRNDGAIQVGVAFDEPISPSSVALPNFTLSGGTVTAASAATNSFGDYAAVIVDTTGLTPGSTYQLTVRNITDKHGNAMPATNVNVTVGNNAWANTGTPIRPGQVVPVGANGFDVLNGGRQEWGSYDEATIAYVKKTNNFDVKVQVVYAEPASQWARAGLMARNELNDGEPSGDRSIATGTASAYAQTHVNPSQTVGSSGRWLPTDPVQPVNNTPNNGHEQNMRTAMGGATAGWGSGVGGVPNYPNVWLRMLRTNDTLHAFRSEDGSTWTDQGTVVLTDQKPDMYVGPFFAVETGNIWPGAGFDVWGAFNANYDRLYVAQFRNFGDVLGAPPTISISVSGANKVITFTGKLYTSPTVNGTYTPLDAAVSPYTIPTGAPAGFYRSGP